MLTDTPRTDAVVHAPVEHEWVRADFARQLERELIIAVHALEYCSGPGGPADAGQALRDIMYSRQVFEESQK
jgi:hypothetical protein